MLNMLDTQDNLKNFSEDQLIREMQMPSGSAPQFMVLGEIERRKRMRADSQRQQGLMQPTVAQEAITAAGVPQQGIAGIAQSLAPQTDMTQNTGVPNVQAAGLPGQPNQPQRMADGGVLKLAPGGDMEMAPAFDPQSSILARDPYIVLVAGQSGMSVDDYISTLSPEVRAEMLQHRLHPNARYIDGVDEDGFVTVRSGRDKQMQMRRSPIPRARPPSILAAAEQRRQDAIEADVRDPATDYGYREDTGDGSDRRASGTALTTSPRPPVRPAGTTTGTPLETPAGGIEALLPPPRPPSDGPSTAVESLRVNFPDIYDRVKNDPFLLETTARAYLDTYETPEQTTLESSEAAPSVLTGLRSAVRPPVSNRRLSQQSLADLGGLTPEQYALDQRRQSLTALRGYDADDPIFAEGSPVQSVPGAFAPPTSLHPRPRIEEGSAAPATSPRPESRPPFLVPPSVFGVTGQDIIDYLNPPEGTQLSEDFVPQYPGDVPVEIHDQLQRERAGLLNEPETNLMDMSRPRLEAERLAAQYGGIPGLATDAVDGVAGLFSNAGETGQRLLGSGLAALGMPGAGAFMLESADVTAARNRNITEEGQDRDTAAAAEVARIGAEIERRREEDVFAAPVTFGTPFPGAPVPVATDDETILPPGVSPLATPSSDTTSSDTTSSDTTSSDTSSSGTPSSGTPSSGASDDEAPASGSSMDQDKWLALAHAGFTLMSTGDAGKAGQAGLAAYSQYKQAAQDARKLEAELAFMAARTSAAGRSNRGGTAGRPSIADLNYARDQLAELEGQLASVPGADPTYLFGSLGGADEYAIERTRLTNAVGVARRQVALLEAQRFGSPLAQAAPSPQNRNVSD